MAYIQYFAKQTLNEFSWGYLGFEKMNFWLFAHSETGKARIP
jgi:hypothetical protein